jgi:hypothetical protein
MKNISVFDIAFIAITSGIFSLIHYLGYEELLSTYALITALIAYFIGKYFGKIELKRKQK